MVIPVPEVPVLVTSHSGSVDCWPFTFHRFAPFRLSQPLPSKAMVVLSSVSLFGCSDVFFMLLVFFLLNVAAILCDHLCTVKIACQRPVVKFVTQMHRFNVRIACFRHLVPGASLFPLRALMQIYNNAPGNHRSPAHAPLLRW